MYANLVQVCTAINREFLFPGARKKKKKLERASGIQCLFCYPVLPMAYKKANKVDIATNLIQLHKVLRFRTMYLQFFYALSFVATVHGL